MIYIIGCQRYFRCPETPLTRRMTLNNKTGQKLLTKKIDYFAKLLNAIIYSDIMSALKKIMTDA